MLETAIVTCSTSKGDLVFELYEKWAPHGYKQAVYLFESGFYNNLPFYRVQPGFLVQFGLSLDEPVPTIPDDLPGKFERGSLGFAGK
jgi:cyclophilin family peptidyl-prolyl cis-trans isomerase